MKKNFGLFFVTICIIIMVGCILFATKGFTKTKEKPSKETIVEKVIQCPALHQGVKKLYETRANEFLRLNPSYTSIDTNIELLFCYSKTKANFRIVTKTIFSDGEEEYCLLSIWYTTATIINTAKIKSELTMEPQYETCEKEE